MKTSHVAIPFQGMDLRELEGARLVSNMQPDRWGGLVNRPPFLQVTLSGFPNFAGYDVVLIPLASSGATTPHVVFSTSASSQWYASNLGSTSPCDPDAPAAAVGSLGGLSSPTSLVHSYVHLNGITAMGGGTTLAFVTAPGAVTTTSMPFAAKFFTGLPWENRLVIAAGDRVQFSDLNAYGTFGTDNWVDVLKGDGESISGVAMWGNYTFVFKQSRFFVFYGTSTDADGEPVFNFRTVSSPGAMASVYGAGGAVVAGERGVYHCTPQGEIRLTTGGPSRPLDPPCPSIRHNHLVYHHGRLYALRTYVDGAAGPTGQPHEASSIVYVYEEAQRAWTQWQAPGPVQRLVPVGRSLVALVKDSTYTSLRWMAPDYNVDQVGATEYELLTLENGAAGEYITGGLDFGAPGVERTMLDAGLVLDPNMTVDSALPTSSLFASARGQDDARVPDWTTDSAEGTAPYLRCTGGLGTRHWLYAQTETAARWVGLHATVTEPTGGRDYRDGDVS